MTGPKENAASATTDNGVNLLEKASQLSPNNTPKPRFNAMSKYAKPAHKRVAKALGYALTLGTESAWRGFTIILMANLSDAERAAIGFATLNSQTDDHAYMTASVALFGTLNGEVVA